MYAKLARVIEGVFPLPVVVARKLSVDAALGVALFVVYFKLRLVAFASAVDAVETKAAAGGQVFDEVYFYVSIAVDLLAITSVVTVVAQLGCGVTHVGIGRGTTKFPIFINGNYRRIGSVGVEYNPTGFAVVVAGDKG